MASSRVSQRLIEAILSQSIIVTRRTEIYESDGVTLWSSSQNTPRLVTGAVSVDSSRAERRTLECTFDNSDQVLNHSPDGFWYDKIIKPFRGIRYPNTHTVPKILIIDDSTDNNFKGEIILRRLGFDVTVNLNPVSIIEFEGYDLIVSWLNTDSPVAIKYNLLKEAYTAGYAIFTMGSNVLAADVPLIVTSVAKADSTEAVLKIGSYDSPVKGGLQAGTEFFGMTSTSVQLITAIRTTAGKALDISWNGTTYIGGIFEENAGGSRWFHMTHQRFAVEYYRSGLWLGQLIQNIVNWLFNYSEFLEWETQIGEFMIDRIRESSDSALIAVTGRDYTKKLLISKFTSSVTFAAGQSLDSVVSAIAANGGVLKFIAGATGVTIENSISFERTTERWKAIDDLCKANGVEVFFNSEGYLVTRIFRDPVTSPTVVTLHTGVEGNLVSYEKSSSDTRISNIVVVTGENSEEISAGNLYQYIAYNTEPSSPTRVARLGERHYFYTSAFFTSEAQCRTVAENFLAVQALEEYELGFSSLAFPWLESGEIVEFIDPTPGSGEPSRFLLTQFNIPLALGPMSGSGKRVSIVGSGA